jgi:cardiolipin synthase
LPTSGVEAFVDGNLAELLRDGAEAFPSMLRAIEAAEQVVWMEMYWFDSDQIGQRFFAALVDASTRGVAVRLMVDAFGSYSTDSACFQRLRAAGAQVVEFHPLRPFQRRVRLDRLTVRNHRKLLVVDFRQAFIGGINVADAWLPVEEGGQGWRDDVVRVRGPVVSGLTESFAASWLEACGQTLGIPTEATQQIGKMKAAVLSQAHYSEKLGALQAYLTRLWQARDQILIANAYFIPNSRIRRALVMAARRGVDVKIMLPAKSDVPLVRHASRAAWGSLLRHGARIYEWQPSMLHSKTAVIDRQWTTIGSLNLDYMSLRNNRELNLSVLDDDFAAVVAASFDRDLASCREVDASEFQFRSLGERLLERVLYWFRWWL